MSKSVTAVERREMRMRSTAPPGLSSRMEVISPHDVSVPVAAEIRRVPLRALSPVLNWKAQLCGEATLKFERALSVYRDALVQVETFTDNAQARRCAGVIGVRPCTPWAACRTMIEAVQENGERHTSPTK